MELLSRYFIKLDSPNFNSLLLRLLFHMQSCLQSWFQTTFCIVSLPWNCLCGKTVGEFSIQVQKLKRISSWLVHVLHKHHFTPCVQTPQHVMSYESSNLPVNITPLGAVQFHLVRVKFINSSFSPRLHPLELFTFHIAYLSSCSAAGDMTISFFNLGELSEI